MMLKNENYIQTTMFELSITNVTVIYFCALYSIRIYMFKKFFNNILKKVYAANGFIRITSQRCEFSKYIILCASFFLL